MARNLLTRKEAAARLGVSLVTLDAERADGYLAYIQRKPGGKGHITEDAIAENLARATHQAKRPRKPTQGTYRRRRA